MENIYEDIIDSIEDGIVVLDGDLKVTLFNQVAENITGISKSRSLQAPCSDIFAGNMQVMEQASKTLSTGQVFSDYDSNILRKDGTALPVSLTTSPILSSSGEMTGIVLLIRDRSRIKSLEDDVRRSDSLASVGILAAGLAHEIKNPLGGIKGAAQLLEMELGDDEELLSYTGIIIKETERVSRLLEELLDFANPKKLNLGEFNIHKVLDSVVALMKRSKEGEGVNFTAEYDPSIPPLIGDSEKLAQVFLNIIKNGCEAMEGGGDLRLVTRVISEFLLHEKEGLSSKMMVVEICDSGDGMAEDEVRQLFAPFYTTKKGGTGLGLSMSHRIVKEHGGIIKVKSSQGKGSTFSVFLPLR